MTLFKKLMLLIVSLFVICLSGTLYLTFENSKTYYLEQLRANAQDTATSLGVSLSMHINDKAYMLSMVDAVFDRGYFAKISVFGEHETLLLSREQFPNHQDIPNWFISFVKFPKIERTSLIITGWKEAGEIKVISDPSNAYLDLWKTSLELFYWFLGLLLAFLVVVYIGMNALFKPLYQAVELARSICRSEFKVLEKKPSTPELRMLIDALNKMVVKLKELFKANAKKINVLQQELFVDKLTSYGNRSYFEQKIRSLLTDETFFSRGFLLFLEINKLKEFNNQYGLEEGDKLILKTKELIEECFSKEDLLFKARITGASFALVISGLEQKALETNVKLLMSKLKTLYAPLDIHISAELGGSSYQFKQDRSHLLASVDKALVMARSLGAFSFFFEKGESEQNQLSAREWRVLLQGAIDQQSFSYFSQPVLSSDNHLFHKEIFIKLPFKSNYLLTAGDFIPVAEKFSLTASIDLLVLERAFELVASHNEPISLNVSKQLIKSANEQEKYLNKLSKNRKLSSKIHFEISESMVSAQQNKASNFITALNDLGFVVGIDRVGGSLIDVSYLSELNVSFIKIDSSITTGISQNEHKQKALQTLLLAANSLEVTPIATFVESDEQWQTLQKLGINFSQGTFIGEPTALNNA